MSLIDSIPEFLRCAKIIRDRQCSAVPSAQADWDNLLKYAPSQDDLDEADELNISSAEAYNGREPTIYHFA